MFLCSCYILTQCNIGRPSQELIVLNVTAKVVIVTSEMFFRTFGLKKIEDHGEHYRVSTFWVKMARAAQNKKIWLVLGSQNILVPLFPSEKINIPVRIVLLPLVKSGFLPPNRSKSKRKGGDLFCIDLVIDFVKIEPYSSYLMLL